MTVVEEQTVKDTEFSTVKVPNPEFKETLSMGIDLANKIKADVVFGTDPDSDRLGVAVKNDKGEFIALSGNQVGILLLDYILTRLKEENALPKNAAVVKSFVSTGMAKAICDDFGVAMFETPVGFKFIGEKIKQWEQDGSHTLCVRVRGIVRVSARHPRARQRRRRRFHALRRDGLLLHLYRQDGLGQIAGNLRKVRLRAR